MGRSNLDWIQQWLALVQLLLEELLRLQHAVWPFRSVCERDLRRSRRQSVGGTYSGLNRFNQGRFYNVLDNEGLPFDRVNALLEDREGDVWVGSREGLVRLTPKRFSTITRRQGLTHDNVTSVLQDRNGSMWVGTWGGGVNQMKDDKIVPQVLTNTPGKNVVLSPPQSPFWKGADVPVSSQSPGLVSSLCEGHDGSLWIGADFDGGLTRLKDGRARRYDWKEGFTNGGCGCCMKTAAPICGWEPIEHCAG